MKEEKHLEIYQGVEGRYWNENVSARSSGLRQKAETAISCRGTGPTSNKQICQKKSGGGGRGYECVPVWLNNRVGLTQ